MVKRRRKNIYQTRDDRLISIIGQTKAEHYGLPFQ
jgi:hypothetical protein